MPDVTLLPCVRCGSAGTIGRHAFGGVTDTWVDCTNHECPIETGIYESDEDAIDAWNTMGANRIVTEQKAALAIAQQHIAELEQQLQNAWRARDLALVDADKRIASLKSEVADKQETIDLFGRCLKRAREKWCEAHPDKPLMWPDGAESFVWLWESLQPRGTCATCVLYEPSVCADTGFVRDPGEFCPDWQGAEADGA
jgi:hypothetical protein